MKKIFSVFIFLFFLNACKGTEVGNPSNENTCLRLETTGDSSLNSILEQLCERASTCSGTVSAASCFETVNARTEEALVAKLGPFTNISLAELRSRLTQGINVANTTNLATCLTDIQAISCETVNTQLSFPEVANLDTVVPTNCHSVFTYPFSSGGEPQCP